MLFCPFSSKVSSGCSGGTTSCGRAVMANDLSDIRISVEVADDAGQPGLLAATRTLKQELSSVGRAESARSATPSGAKGLEA